MSSWKPGLVVVADLRVCMLAARLGSRVLFLTGCALVCVSRVARFRSGSKERQAGVVSVTFTGFPERTQPF